MNLRQLIPFEVLFAYCQEVAKLPAAAARNELRKDLMSKVLAPNVAIYMDSLRDKGELKNLARTHCTSLPAQLWNTYVTGNVTEGITLEMAKDQVYGWLLKEVALVPLLMSHFNERESRTAYEAKMQQLEKGFLAMQPEGRCARTKAQLYLDLTYWSPIQRSATGQAVVFA